MTKLLLALILLTPCIAKAQFTKGDKVLGGTFSYFSQDPRTQNGGHKYGVKNFSATPKLGILLNECFAVGALAGFSLSERKVTDYLGSTVEYKSKSLVFGSFGQRYFRISDTFLFSIIGQIDFSRGSDEYPEFNQFLGTVEITKHNSYSFSTSVKPTFIFFPSANWGFEASIGSISHTFFRNLSTDEKTDYVILNYGGLALGVSYYFRN